MSSISSDLLVHLDRYKAPRPSKRWDGLCDVAYRWLKAGDWGKSVAAMNVIVVKEVGIATKPLSKGIRLRVIPLIESDVLYISSRCRSAFKTHVSLIPSLTIRVVAPLATADTFAGNVRDRASRRVLLT